MIKHYYVSGARYGKPEQDNYLCNRVPFPNEDKIEYDWKKVTCKKCLRKIR